MRSRRIRGSLDPVEERARFDVLRLAPAFERLGDDDLRALAACAVHRTFAPGDTLLAQGEPGDSLWILVGGIASVRLRRLDGGHVELARLMAADVAGEMALITGATRNADVVAIEPGAALVLPRAGFEDVARSRPDVVSVLTELVARRLGRAAQDGLGDKVIEGYRILRPVGRGATAVVYEAEPLVPGPSGGARTALKMLSHRFARDRAAMEWFEREARMLDEVSHDGVARSYGRFHAYGTCFLAIEFVDGPTALDMLRVLHRLDVPDALAIAGSVAAALGHCHVRGIVHGDVKPANVMADLTGRVVLTDFGIAQYVDTEPAGIAPGGVRVSGTPRYMAPELFVGARPSASTDIYALACVLWELLQGRPAFEPKDLGELILAKRRFEPQAASALRADLPDDVRSMLARALSPHPSERPAHAADMGLAAARVGAAVVEGTLRNREPS